jgi:hypothetical protein
MGMLPPAEVEKARRTLDKIGVLRKEAEVLEAVAHANSSKISFNGQKFVLKIPLPIFTIACTRALFFN